MEQSPRFGRAHAPQVEMEGRAMIETTAADHSREAGFYWVRLGPPDIAEWEVAAWRNGFMDEPHWWLIDDRGPYISEVMLEIDERRIVRERP
jgi:hypothetical protein